MSGCVTFQYNIGRQEDFELWIATIEKVFGFNKEAPCRVMTTFEVIRLHTKLIYSSDVCQIIVALLVAPPL